MLEKISARTQKPMDQAFYRKIKPFKKRIIKRWLRKYYQNVPWAYSMKNSTSPKGVPMGWMIWIDMIFVKPAVCTDILGIIRAAAHFFDIRELDEPMLLAFEKLYEAEKGNIATYLREIYFPDAQSGHIPRLSRTDAIREMVCRGFVDIRDVISSWDKEKYSIIVHDLPLTWPFQFKSQQAGLQFLEGFGIPGYMGCPCPEQGQLALYKRYY